MDLVSMIILKSEDEGETWEIVEPDDVPSKIKDDPEVIDFLQSGCAAQFPDELTIYIGVKYGTGNPTSPIGSKIKLLNQ